MIDEEFKAREIALNNCKHYAGYLGVDADSFEECKASALKMAQWKDELPISDLGGWHKEKPTRDCWVVLERIQGYYDVAYWENTSKHFYYPNEEIAKNWRRWKLLENK